VVTPVSFNASADVERAEMDPLHTTASVEFFNVSVEKVQFVHACVEIYNPSKKTEEQLKTS
jgi:hypothetical protein